MAAPGPVLAQSLSKMTVEKSLLTAQKQQHIIENSKLGFCYGVGRVGLLRNFDPGTHHSKCQDLQCLAYWELGIPGLVPWQWPPLVPELTQGLSVPGVSCQRHSAEWLRPVKGRQFRGGGRGHAAAGTWLFRRTRISDCGTLFPTGSHWCERHPRYAAVRSSGVGKRPQRWVPK